eukprot:CAMPEP_0119572676 /NCGR_PEP_ID=MMETSP1352-20130426/44741_1 /TAXON_ID=265584 /ORGANISM="Stauroneis constricta, Strain CCMP1120" /LENGTH=608 /DNA_ID=CAMNT_0007622361 /DNA_START=508 /DNA_END=2335 /DNA_ORIENTATION=-
MVDFGDTTNPVDQGWYQGQVVGVDKHFFHIQYDDGDEDDMTRDEMENEELVKICRIPAATTEATPDACPSSSSTSPIPTPATSSATDSSSIVATDSSSAGAAVARKPAPTRATRTTTTTTTTTTTIVTETVDDGEHDIVEIIDDFDPATTHARVASIKRKVERIEQLAKGRRTKIKKTNSTRSIVASVHSDDQSVSNAKMQMSDKKLISDAADPGTRKSPPPPLNNNGKLMQNRRYIAESDSEDDNDSLPLLSSSPSTSSSSSSSAPSLKRHSSMDSDGGAEWMGDEAWNQPTEDPDIAIPARRAREQEMIEQRKKEKMMRNLNPQQEHGHAHEQPRQERRKPKRKKSPLRLGSRCGKLAKSIVKSNGASSTPRKRKSVAKAPPPAVAVTPNISRPNQSPRFASETRLRKDVDGFGAPVLGRILTYTYPCYTVKFDGSPPEQLMESEVAKYVHIPSRRPAMTVDGSKKPKKKARPLARWHNRPKQRNGDMIPAPTYEQAEAAGAPQALQKCNDRAQKKRNCTNHDRNALSTRSSRPATLPTENQESTATGTDQRIRDETHRPNWNGGSKSTTQQQQQKSKVSSVRNIIRQMNKTNDAADTAMPTEWWR